MDGARTRLRWEEPREDVKLQAGTPDDYCTHVMRDSVYVTEKDLTTAATLSGPHPFLPVAQTHVDTDTLQISIAAPGLNQQKIDSRQQRGLVLILLNDTIEDQFLLPQRVEAVPSAQTCPDTEKMIYVLAKSLSIAPLKEHTADVIIGVLIDLVTCGFAPQLTIISADSFALACRICCGLDNWEYFLGRLQKPQIPTKTGASRNPKQQKCQAETIARVPRIVGIIISGLRGRIADVAWTRPIRDNAWLLIQHHGADSVERIQTAKSMHSCLTGQVKHIHGIYYDAWFDTNQRMYGPKHHNMLRALLLHPLFWELLGPNSENMNGTLEKLVETSGLQSNVIHPEDQLRACFDLLPPIPPAEIWDWVLTWYITCVALIARRIAMSDRGPASGPLSANEWLRALILAARAPSEDCCRRYLTNILRVDGDFYNNSNLMGSLATVLDGVYPFLIMEGALEAATATNEQAQGRVIFPDNLYEDIPTTTPHDRDSKTLQGIPLLIRARRQQIGQIELYIQYDGPFGESGFLPGEFHFQTLEGTISEGSTTPWKPPLRNDKTSTFSDCEMNTSGNFSNGLYDGEIYLSPKRQDIVRANNEDVCALRLRRPAAPKQLRHSGIRKGFQAGDLAIVFLTASRENQNEKQIITFQIPGIVIKYESPDILLGNATSKQKSTKHFARMNILCLRIASNDWQAIDRFNQLARSQEQTLHHYLTGMLRLGLGGVCRPAQTLWGKSSQHRPDVFNALIAKWNVELSELGLQIDAQRDSDSTGQSLLKLAAAWQLSSSNSTDIPLSLLRWIVGIPDESMRTQFPGIVPILGPPGTGKTHVAIALMDLCFKFNKEHPIEMHGQNKMPPPIQLLATSSTNVAVDVMIRHAIQRFGNAWVSNHVVYLVSSARMQWIRKKVGCVSNKEAKQDRCWEITTLHGGPEDVRICFADAARRWHKQLKSLFNQQNTLLVCCTVSTLAKTVGDFSIVDILADRFHVIFHDEGGKAFPRDELHVPALLRSGRLDGRPGALAIIGDPKQLGPFVRSTAGEQTAMTIVVARLGCAVLRKQYRAHPVLARVTSEAFYNGALTGSPTWSTRSMPGFSQPHGRLTNSHSI